MCGIAGFLDYSKTISKAHLLHASNALKHRGGNGHGIFFKEQEKYTVGLANERLATVDLSEDGTQPFTSNCGLYTITFNGTIYNHKELRTSLANTSATFRSLTDTEVLIECYKKWGFDLFDQIDGAFAFAILDRKLNQLFVARDALGVKPLYYYFENGFFAFASEIKGLLQFPIEKKINEQALKSYLRNGYFIGNATIFQKINHFAKQTAMVFDLDSGTHISKEFNLAKPVSQVGAASEQEILQNVENLLTNSILKRSVTDANIGVLLSGGYDSATLAAILQKYKAETIKTYTLGFEAEKFDEAPFAKKIAAHIKTNHQEFYINDNDARRVVELLPSVFDEPIGDSGAIPLTYLAKQVAHDNTQVILGAEGGDELFAGYDAYKTTHIINNYKKLLPSPLKSVIPKLFNERRHKVNEILSANGFLETYLAINAYFSQTEISALLNKDLCTNSIKTYKTSSLRDSLAHDVENYLPNDLLLKSDRAFMHYGIDNRDTFLNTDLVNYLKSIDQKLLIKNGSLKYLLKQITHKYLPKTLMDRPKKGFSAPIVCWLKGILKPQVEDYLSVENLNKHRLFNAVEVLKLKNSFYIGGANTNAKKIWLLLQFQMWYNKWMD